MVPVSNISYQPTAFVTSIPPLSPLQSSHISPLLPHPPSCPPNRLTPTNSKPPPNPPATPSLRHRLSTFLSKFRRVSAEVQELASSPEGFVLGSDLSNHYIASTSLIQDLQLPPAPQIWDQSPHHTLQILHRHLSAANLPTPLLRRSLHISHQLLPALHGWTHHFADRARPLLSVPPHQPDPTSTSDALDALIHLLNIAAFDVLPRPPDPLNPPCVDQLPLANSMSRVLDPSFSPESPLIQRVVSSRHSSHHPHLFIATRGVTVVRRSGLLLGPKIRAIERLYFNWIRTPVALCFKPFKRLLATYNRLLQQRATRSDGRGENAAAAEDSRQGLARGSETGHCETRKVRRVVPSGRLEGGWKGFNAFFLPTFTQEPAHELILFLYREVVPDRKLSRKERRSALLQRLKRSITEAFNPKPWKTEGQRTVPGATGVSDAGTRSRPGELKQVSLQLFGEVPWGTAHHLYPTSYVLPATKDLLRIDALTFSGLASGVVTFLRNLDNKFVVVLVVGSLVTYLVRVAFGWRRAVVQYNGRLARERADQLIARQRSVLDHVAALGAEERFVDVCCVWLAHVLKDGVSAIELQRELFGQVTLAEEDAQKWKGWLADRGFLL